MRNVFKTKFEYCHITDDKIIITKTPEVEDSITDYSRSIDYVFKTLMVFFIFIPIFTGLSVFLYFDGKYDISIFSGLFALFFLGLSFYLMIFTSSTPIIPKDKIIKITYKRTNFISTIKIKYRDYNRIKYRGMILTDDQVDDVLNILIQEKLIEKKDIKTYNKKAENISYYTALLLSFPLLYGLFLIDNINTFVNNLFFIIIVTTLIFPGLKKAIYYLITKHLKVGNKSDR